MAALRLLEVRVAGAHAKSWVPWRTGKPNVSRQRYGSGLVCPVFWTFGGLPGADPERRSVRSKGTMGSSTARAAAGRRFGAGEPPMDRLLQLQGEIRD